VTRIAALSFGRNASVAYVMKRLVALQVRCKLSLLVISHDTTKTTDRALLNLSDTEITLDPTPTPTETQEPNARKNGTPVTHHDPNCCPVRTARRVAEHES
ncbi:MAG: hypothetical protein K2K94_10890, partial [Muribaculaceae bacterium]|nr:hypothetical protein [Muribaculaceae bacterium]